MKAMTFKFSYFFKIYIDIVYKKFIFLTINLVVKYREP